MTTTNARIESTMLGVEDHGIPTFYLNLTWGASAQGFGGYDLRFDGYGIELLMEILKIVGVSTWEKLPGTLVRIESSPAKIGRIGHITDEKWLDVEVFGRRQ